MCKELQNVTHTEWNELVHTVDKMKMQLGKWAGGLAVILFIIAGLGGWIIKVGVSLSKSVSANKEFNLKSEVRDKNSTLIQERIVTRLDNADEDRKRIQNEIQSKTEERYKKSDAKTDFIELREWIRETREADGNMDELHRLQIQKQIEILRLEIDEIKKNVK